MNIDQILQDMGMMGGSSGDTPIVRPYLVETGKSVTARQIINLNANGKVEPGFPVSADFKMKSSADQFALSVVSANTASAQSVVLTCKNRHLIAKFIATFGLIQVVVHEVKRNGEIEQVYRNDTAVVFPNNANSIGTFSVIKMPESALNDGNTTRVVVPYSVTGGSKSSSAIAFFKFTVKDDEVYFQVVNQVTIATDNSSASGQTTYSTYHLQDTYCFAPNADTIRFMFIRDSWNGSTSSYTIQAPVYAGIETDKPAQVSSNQNIFGLNSATSTSVPSIPYAIWSAYFLNTSANCYENTYMFLRTDNANPNKLFLGMSNSLNTAAFIEVANMNTALTLGTGVGTFAGTPHLFRLSPTSNTYILLYHRDNGVAATPRYTLHGKIITMTAATTATIGQEFNLANNTILDQTVMYRRSPGLRSISNYEVIVAGSRTDDSGATVASRVLCIKYDPLAAAENQLTVAGDFSFMIDGASGNFHNITQATARREVVLISRPIDQVVGAKITTTTIPIDRMGNNYNDSGVNAGAVGVSLGSGEGGQSVDMKFLITGTTIDGVWTGLKPSAIYKINTDGTLTETLDVDDGILQAVSNNSVKVVREVF